jgi:hypothetical protein
MALTVSQAGSANSTVSGATLAIGSVTAAIGDWLVIAIAADNAGTDGVSSVASVTDSAGNSYTLRSDTTYDPGAAADGATLAVFTCILTAALAAGTVTVNFSPNTTACAAIAYRVQPGSGDTIAFRAVGAGSTGNGTAASLTASSVESGDTLFSFAAHETRTAVTADSDTTNGTWSAAYADLADTGAFATSMAVSGQFKTVTATGDQVCDWTTGGARDFAINWLRVYAIPGPSSLAVRALLGLEPDEVVIALLTIEHEAIDTIRVNNDNVDHVSNGETFLSFPFNITLPPDAEEPGVARLEIANVDRSIIEAIELMDGPCVCTVQIILASTPSKIEYEWSNLTLRNVTADDVVVTASIGHPPIDSMPYPPTRVTMRDFPGLYGIGALAVFALHALLSAPGVI